MQKNFKKILVKAPNWVGDALLATPALTSLAAAYPNSEITALASRWVAPVLETHPALSRLWIYDPKGEHKEFKKRIELIRKLRREKFDLAILLPNSLHSALIIWLAGIPNRLGYATDGRSFFLTMPVDLPKDIKSKHQAEYYLDLLRAIEIQISDEDKKLILKTLPEEKKWAQEFLESLLIGKNQPVIAIHPGAVKPGKRWPHKRFAQIGKEIIQNYNAHLLLLGSFSERSLLEDISNQIASPSQTVVCGLSLRQVAALLERCRLFIGNDSGLMHMASAAGIPLIAIFGPGTPGTTAPYNPNPSHKIILKKVPCRPCRQRFFTECRPSAEGAPPCLDEIKIEDVSSAVNEILAAK